MKDRNTLSIRQASGSKIQFNDRIGKREKNFISIPESVNSIQNHSPKGPSEDESGELFKRGIIFHLGNNGIERFISLSKKHFLG